MLARNCTVKDLEKALALVNRKRSYDGALRLEGVRPEGRGFRFVLRLISGHRGKGAALTTSFLQHARYGRERSPWPGNRKFSGSACWHAHGHFFEALLKVRPEAVVLSRGSSVRISADGGNWQDYNVGSQMYPCYASEACECNGKVG